jgi:probable phosphoglycerate mutase
VTGDADQPERQIWLVRHGETEWARLGRHTGRTDVPLTDFGRDQGERLGRRLRGQRFVRVLVSPRTRAIETARLAGYGDELEIDDDLREWDYGDNEGRTTDEIRDDVPGWSIWTGPWPNGERAEEVGIRADRVLARCLAPTVRGDVLLFGHGHQLRVLAARWIGLAPADGRRLALATATVSVLGWEREQRVIERWNEPAGEE